MVNKFINYSKKIFMPFVAISYGVYLNYSFFKIVESDYNKQKNCEMTGVKLN